MKGGFYFDKAKQKYVVWYPCKERKGGKVLFRRASDGGAIFHEDQAKRVLEKIRAEVDENKGVFNPALYSKDKVLLLQNAWKVYQNQSPCKKDRRDARQRIYDTLIEPHFGKDRSIEEIEEEHIKDWWEKAIAPKNYAPRTQLVIRATLRAFLNFHRVTRVKMIKFPTVEVPEKRPDWLTQEQQEKVLEFVPERHRPIIIFLIVYGCRVSEACNLRKGDIDWEKNSITFRERKNKKENDLPVFDSVKPYLRGGKVTHMEFVFCTSRGNRYNKNFIYYIWTQANRMAHEKYGIKIVAPKNGTRHSRACQLLNRGETKEYAARFAGNSPGVIWKFYGDIPVETIREREKERAQG